MRVMTEQRDTTLLRLHRKRLAVWGLNQGPTDAPVVRPESYEREVIDRAERVLDGRDYAIAHAHQQYEMGMCVECDVAALVDLFRASGESEGT